MMVKCLWIVMKFPTEERPGAGWRETVEMLPVGPSHQLGPCPAPNPTKLSPEAAYVWHL